MQTQLQKAIDLIKKTGDRLLVFDSAKSDDIYVIMSLKDYRNLILGKSEVRGLTEDELLDKINRDIAIWKSEQGDQGYEQGYNNKNNLKIKQEIKQVNKFKQVKQGNDMNFGFNDMIDDMNNDDNMNNIDIDNFDNNKKKLGNIWSIPNGIKEGAEEVIEEDRQYLEDITF